MSYYQRDLPHWRPEGAALFVTWRLNGSRPRNCDVPKRVKLEPGQAFILDDREWNRAAVGPRWLADPRLAQCVVEALFYGGENLELYTLRAPVIMCNHAHILIFPNALVPRITKSVKNYSAQYIEGNPVAVDLCDKPEDWRWSSAHAGREACATRPAPQGAETRLV